MNDASSSRPVQLHVIHDLGGGSAKWLSDFARADASRTNLVLKSFAFDTAAGGGIALFSAPDDDADRAQRFTHPIAATAIMHSNTAAFGDVVGLRHRAVSCRR
jgi:hypothetical protein